MKKILTIILTISTFLSFAQAPQGINYQGLARNANGIIANQNIGLKFIITNSSNTNVYEETHAPQTNLYGLFTATIGLGAQVGTNSFSVIPWGTGTYFIETQIDPAGGTSYTTLGRQQFMSVPYALYANEAKNVNTYSLVTSANTATLIQNGNTNVGTINLTSTPNTTISSSNSNLIVNNPSTNSFALTVPNYSITNGANTNTIVLSNGANSSTVVIPTSSQISQTITAYSGNITVANPSANVFGIDAPTYSITGTNTNTIVLSNGVHSSTVVIPTSTSYTAGTGISISSGSIINTAPNQTVTLTGTGVSGTYPSYTINPSPTTIVAQGNSNITVTQSGNTYSVSAVTPTLSVIGATLSGSYPNQTLTVPTSSTTILTASTNINISGSAPNYIISSPSQSLSLTANTLSLTNSPSVTLPTYSLASNSNSITIYQNGTVINTTTIALTATTSISQGTNIIVSGSSPNYTISSPSQSLSLIANTLSLTNSPSVTLPTYSLASNSNSITIYQNGNIVNTTTLTVPTLSLTGSILQSGPSTNTVNLSSLNGIYSGSGSLTAAHTTVTVGTNTLTFLSGNTFNKPVVNFFGGGGTGTHLSIGHITSNPVSIKFLGNAITSPINYGFVSAFSSGITMQGGNASEGLFATPLGETGAGIIQTGNGKFVVTHAASTTAPSIHLRETTSGLNRIKLSNTSIAAKYFEIAGGTNSNPALEAVTINYFNGTIYRTVFQLDGNKRIGINPLESIQSSLHVMEDNSGVNTPSVGIISEGFNKPGQLILSSTTPNGTFPTYTRSAVPASTELGKLVFAGSTGATTFGDGAKIYAKSVNAFTGSNTGADLIFATTPNGTNNNVDQMVILNNGRVGIGTTTPTEKLDILGSIKIKDGSEAVGYVLTSDANGKGTWMPPTMINSSPWIKSGAIVTLSTTTDNVGIGTNTPTSKLEVVSSGIRTILADNSGSGTTFMADKSAGSGYVAYIRNASSGNISEVVRIENTLGGTGNALNASNTSNTNATIFAKNNNFNGIAGNFDGGINTYNSGSLASIYAFKSNSSTGNVAVFTNSTTTNAGDVVQISNTSGADGHGIWVNTGSSTKAAGYFGNTGVGVEVASGNEGVKVSSTSNIAALTATMNGTGSAIRAVSNASSKNALELVDGHIKSSQTTVMSGAITAAVGGSGTGSFTSNIFLPNSTDVKGGVRLNNNFGVAAGFNALAVITPATAELIITVPFNKIYTNPPVVIITPTSDMQGGLPSVVSSNGSFTVTFRWRNCETQALTISNPSFNYMVME